MKMLELYNRLSRVPAILDEILRELDDLKGYIRYKSQPKEPKKQFVCILIECLKKEQIYSNKGDWDCLEVEQKVTEKFSLHSVAMSAYISDVHVFSMQPHQTIKNLRITIFCDLSQVLVEDIKCANQLLCASYEMAPMAFFEGVVEPCNRLTIQCRVRNG